MPRRTTSASGTPRRGTPHQAFRYGGAVRRRPVVRDSRWVPETRRAGYCGAAFLGLAVLVDAGTGELTVARAVVWVVFGATVFALLAPPRVTAGDGWLAVRGLVRQRRVRTDMLVSVSRHGAVAVHLLLRDVYGHRVEVDPRILVASPLLWHQLDIAAQKSDRRGMLRFGRAVLRDLREQIDSAGAAAVFDASGL